MTLPYNNGQLDHARSLRKTMTPQERHLWFDFLRDYPVKVYKQRIIGSYIVDFYCDAAKLVIELDGSQHYEPNGQNQDAVRTQYLQSLGLTVVRYSNAEINREFRAVCDALDRLIRSRTGR